MTPDRDIDRLLDAFLADGADEVPDRVLDTAFARIERTSQVRPAPTRRFTPMVPVLRLGFAAGLLLVLGIGIVPMLAPSPAPSPIPTPTPGYLPTELQHPWLAPSRRLDEMRTQQDRAILRLGQSSATIFSGREDYEGNGRPIDAGITDTGDLVVRNRTAANGCEPGDEGIYTPALRENGQWLSLTLVSDDCELRSRWMTGDDWLRSQCLNPDNQCLGMVEPGTYPSQFFSPRVPLGEDWRADLGTLTWTAPAGWAGTDDWPANYGVMPADAYAEFWSSDTQDPVWPDTVMVWARPAIVEGDACSFEHAIGGGRSPEELATALAAVPGIEATTPEPIDIGGRAGVTLDIRIADGWTGTCPDILDGRPFVPALAEHTEDGYRIGLGGQDPTVAGRDPQRVIFLDIGAGDVVAITIGSLTDDGFAAFADEAMPIVESFRFRD
jgi:hypothetical protein